MEVRNIELHHLDFDRQMLHVVEGKGQKDRYVPLSEHLIRGLKTFISVENPTQYLFNGNQNRNIEEIDQVVTNRLDFDSRYSQRGVQWVIKTISKKAGITKEVHTHTLNPPWNIFMLFANCRTRNRTALWILFSLCAAKMETRSKGGSVADVLRKINLSAQNFTVHQEKTLRALSYCRTAALGGHIDACDG